MQYAGQYFLRQLIPALFSDRNQARVRAFLYGGDKCISLQCDGTQNEIGPIEDLDEGLSEHRRKAFHPADFVYHHNNIVMFGLYGRHGNFIDVLKVDPISAHPLATPDIDMGQDSPAAVQGGDGKSHPAAPLPHLPGKEPRARSVQALNDLFDDR